MSAPGRVQRKVGLRFTPIECSLTGQNRASTYEVIFIPFRPTAEIVRQLIKCYCYRPDEYYPTPALDVGPSGKPLLDGRRRIILNNSGRSVYSIQGHLPDKTFIGRIGKGFDFLGCYFSREPLRVAEKTREKHVLHIIRLYEQLRQKKATPPNANC